MMDQFSTFLEDAEHHSLRRYLRQIQSPCQGTIEIEGKPHLLFASNDYLGLANHPAIKQAAIEGIEQWGVGSGASRLISGTYLPHQTLEQDLATFKGTEAALTFGSGYLANVGCLPSLIGQGGLIIADQLCHASLLDGCRLTRADVKVFHHNDPDHLQKLLNKRTTAHQRLILTEGVFSMDGDVAPIPDLLTVAQRFGAQVLIDDAHGTGVMGKHGRGTLEHFNLGPNTIFQMGTLSKALGVSGGYVAGTTSLTQYLLNTARSFIYTTAPPPAMACAAREALKILQQEPDRRTRLWDNRNSMYEGLKALGFSLTSTQSPILPVIIPHARQALEFSHHLMDAGILIPAVRPPTVPKESSRLRITVTSEHTPEHIAKVLHTFKSVGEKMGII
jgi:glycine C-acetyltransferase/8-amino-7-oxononanoate synthase